MISVFSKSKLLVSTALVAASVASTPVLAKDITLNYMVDKFASGATWNGTLYEVYTNGATTDTHQIYLTGVERAHSIDITTGGTGTAAVPPFIPATYNYDQTYLYGTSTTAIWSCKSTDEAATCSGGTYSTGEDPAASGNAATFSAPVAAGDNVNIGSLTLNVSAGSNAGSGIPDLGTVTGSGGTLNISQDTTAAGINITSSALNLIGGTTVTVTGGTGSGVVDLGVGSTLILGSGVSSWSGEINGNAGLRVYGDTTFSSAVGESVWIEAAYVGYDTADVVFNSTLTVSNNVFVAGTGSVTFNDDVNSNLIVFQDEGEVNLGNGINVGNSISTTTNGEGKVNILGALDMSGSLGQAGFLLNTITLEGSGDAEVGGVLYTTDLVFEGDATLIVDGAAVVTGDVISSGGNGSLVFKGGVNIANAIDNIKGIRTTGGTNIFSGDVNVAGDIDVAGTTNFAGTVDADNIETAGITTFADAVTVSTNIDTSGATIFSSTVNATGDIDTSGTTTFLNNVTATGDIDTSGITDFTGIVLATNLDTSGTTTFSNNVAVSGDIIAGGTLNDFDGIVTATNIVTLGTTNTFAGNVVATGDIGVGGVTNEFDSSVTASNLIITTGTNTFSGVVNVAEALELNGTNSFYTASADTIKSNGGNSTFSGSVVATTSMDLALGNNTFNSTVTTPILDSGAGLSWFQGVVNIDQINIKGLGTARFDKKLTTEDINFIAPGILDLNKTYDHDITFGIVDGTVMIADGEDLLGNISADADDTGNLIIEGTSELDGTIGKDHSLNTITVTSATGKTTNFNETVNVSLLTTTDGNVNFKKDAQVRALIIDGTGLITYVTPWNSDTIDFTSAGLFNLNFDYTGDIDFNNNAGVIVVAGGVNLAGSVDSTGGVNGTLVFSGSSKVDATIGDAIGISAITLNGGSEDTVSFTNNVTATTLTLGDVNTTFNKNIVATTTTIVAGDLIVKGNINSSASIALGSGESTFEGTVNTDVFTLGSGAATFNDTVTSTTSITTGSGINEFNEVVTTPIFNQNTGTTIFNNNFTGDLMFESGGLVEIADGRVFTGSIDTDASGQGEFIFRGSSSGITTIGATNPLDVILIEGVGKTVTASGNIISPDTLDINTNILETTGGTFAIGAGQSFVVDISSSITNGKVISSGSAIVNSNSLFEVGLNVAEFIEPNTQYTIVDGVVAGGAVSTLNNPIINNSLLVGFTQVVNTDDMIVNTSLVPVTDPSIEGLNDNAKEMLTTLYDIATTADVEISQLQGWALSASTVPELQAALEKGMPLVDGGEIRSVINSNAQLQGLLEQRITDIRLVDSYSQYGLYGSGYSGSTSPSPSTGSSPLNQYGFGSGVSGGSSPLKSGIWTQGFITNVIQDKQDGVSGYMANTYGVAFGFDNSNVIDGGIFGLSGNFGQTTITSDLDNGFETEIQTYGLTVYSNYTFSNAIFLNAQFGYSYNDIMGHRYDVGGIGNTASAAYDNNQLSAKASIGRDVSMFGGISTSSVSVSSAQINTTGYTETGGGGGANLTVEDQEHASVKAGVNLKHSWILMSKKGSLLQPHVSVGYTHEFMSDPLETEASFVGAGSAFIIKGQEIDPHTVNMGFGATYVDGNNWELSGAFDYSYREGYDSYTSLMKATSYF